MNYGLIWMDGRGDRSLKAQEAALKAAGVERLVNDDTIPKLREGDVLTVCYAGVIAKKPQDAAEWFHNVAGQWGASVVTLEDNATHGPDTAGAASFMASWKLSRGRLQTAAARANRKTKPSGVTFLRRMTDDERQALKAAYVGGKTKAELARQHGKPWLQIHRALRELGCD